MYMPIKFTTNEEKQAWIAQSFSEVNIKPIDGIGFVIWRRHEQEPLEKPLAVGLSEDEAWNNAVINVDDKDRLLRG